MIVGVLVELSNKKIDRIFDYRVEERFIDSIKIGIRVEVPFGHQVLEGFILEIKKDSDVSNLKSIINIIDQDIILNRELIELGKTIQKKTLATLISCYQVMLPKALKAKKNTIINKKYDIYYKLNENIEGNFNKKQQEIINKCMMGKIKKEELVKISPSSLKTLIKKNILIEEKKEHYRLGYQDSSDKIKELTINQQRVVESVDLEKEDTYLLHGVTGSGKTEVYIKLIEKVLKNHKTALMLVPEISLTPQMVQRFSEVFGNRIAALHSALSEGEKYDEWRKINRKEVSIVIGARSAIFAPLSNLGIIIIDEEHSDSYKQDNNPRYDARDVAIIRSKTNHCPLVMGSATPSLESFARAGKGVFQLLSMPNRINGKKLPQVELIDMNQEIKKGNSYFSSELVKQIRDRLYRNEQVILLLNRRGYASFITCKNCGYTAKCPHCDITLTYHKTSNMLRCHYCGYATNLDKKCPECKEEAISSLGIGTERVEEELRKILKNARILRMDYDTTSRKGMHSKMISEFKNREYDILLGTQIVAKGLDFEDVTLVGVINADTSLNIPDFRSSETTFSLLSQVSGRSGRSNKEGSVIIQTFNPDHYAIQFVKNHDYIGFYRKEMKIRYQLKYPPYYYICYLKVSSKNCQEASRETNKIKRCLEKNLKEEIILGPSPANVFKLNNIYRYGIIIKYKKDISVYPILNNLVEHYRSNNKVNLELDFNPNHF
ncbi:MAG: primosomal protein N' [Bacilli bacterium]|nr:primosomal protein N' [Bacilli bacterium]